MKPTLQNALSLLHENVKSLSLINHCRSVGFVMKEYAIYFNLPKELQEIYEITGILHDFDYEKFPSLEQHPFQGIKILKSLDYPEEIIQAILGHGNHTNTPRTTKLAKTLFAVDELSGFVLALAKVRPGNFESMTPKSIKKALKKKGFAQAINRDEIKQGIDELNVEKDKHFQIVINALSKYSKELGF
jgi:predicted hydrolase (HD superfamily)